MISGLCEYFGITALYLSVGGFVFSLIGQTAGPFAYFGIFAAAGAACSFASASEKWYRFLPLLLTVPAFIIGHNVAAWLLPVPLLFFTAIKTYRRNWLADTFRLKELLPGSLIAYIFILIVSLLGGVIKRLTAESLPMFVIWLAMAVVSMRLARSEMGLKPSGRFYVLNISAVAALVAGSFLLTSRPVIAAVKAALAWLYTHIIVKVILYALYIILFIPVMIVTWLANIIGEIHFKTDVFENIEGMADDFAEMFSDIEVAKVPSWIAPAAKVVVILLFLLLAFSIARKIAGNRLPKGLSLGEITRERVSGQAPQRKRQKLFGNSPSQIVRQCYRKYLEQCRGWGIDVDGRLASDEIRDRSAGYAGAENAERIRELWLPARYSDAESDEEDAKQAKKLLKDIKKG
jgi:hypothetical protein